MEVTMSEGSNLTELLKLKVMAPRLQRIDHEFNTWAHDVAADIDWRETLKRECWERNFEKLRAGDRIEVHSSDHRIQFSVLILAINAAVDPVYLDLAFLPIFPPDLSLPVPERQ